MKQKQNSIVLLSGILSALCMRAAPSQAQDATQADDRSDASLYADAEIDPIAYALKGYSIHVGIGFERLRIDLGAFAMDLPQFIEPSEGFDTSFNGYGLKLQYFPFTPQSGGFVGIDAGLAHVLIEADSSDAASRQLRFSAGIQLGWRFLLGAGFYASPWIGASYDFGADDIQLDGQTYEAAPFSPFATIHLGYRFR